MRTARVGVSALFLGLSLALTACNTVSVIALEEQAHRASERQQYDTAAAKYRQALEQSPGRVHSRVGLGKTLLKMDQPREARRNLELALAARPDDAEILDLLAESMVRSGDNEAMYRLLRGRAEQRNAVADWMRLGKFAAQAGDADVAENALMTAATLDRGQNPEPQIALADFYESIGAEEQALRRLRMALYLEPGDLALQDRIRAMGETPGPTFALQPVEQQ
ncbi:MAG: tetratricopeptide repeat protein [Phycisphaerales bacterium]